jgi:2-methylcitrate dehydratase PrpD
MLAAQLAAVGFTGAHAILEGDLGFWHGLCPDAQPERLLEASDGPWLIHETSFKPWPACRHAHPTIDAALALRGEVDPALIERILLSGYHDAVTICDNPSPKTPVQAKFSLQHAAAVVMLRGRPVLEDFDMATVGQAEVKLLRSKVVLCEDPALSQRYPARFGGAMQITLTDGRTLTHVVEDALGDPENPIDADAVADKTRMLLGAAGYGGAATEQVIGAACALAESTDLDALMNGLQ